MIAGPWQMTPDGTGAMRVRFGGDPNNVDDRVAFIEKTPRIRIRERNRDHKTDYLNWAERRFKGDGPFDPESRKWCDDALRLFGHYLPE